MTKFDDLLTQAVKLSASDIHLQENSVPYFRINGKLCLMSEITLTDEDMREIAATLMNGEERQAFENNTVLDKAYNYSAEGKSFRLRINFSLTGGKTQIAIRLLSADLSALRSLELPKEIFQAAEKPSGLFLITGATGSGKSTTLAAVVQYINERFCKHIITLEDPVEYLFSPQKSLITQKEYGADFNDMPFAIRNAMRQDPDIIVVGEIRDANTVTAALGAAETGHLVLATLHTSNVSQTASRIVDLAASDKKELIRSQFADTLAGIMSQKLIMKKGENERIAVTELLISTPAVRNLIKEGKTEQLNNIMQTGAAVGMHTFEQDLNRLRAEGTIL